jgi:hypothetical protein
VTCHADLNMVNRYTHPPAREAKGRLLDAALASATA